MRHLIYTLIAILIAIFTQSCVAVKVASNKVSEIKAKTVNNPHVLAKGTKFSNNKEQKKWSNSTGDSYFSASFAEFSGTAYMELTVSKPLILRVSHNINISSGTLKMILEDSKSNAVFSKSINGDSKESIQYQIPDSGTYYLKMTGNDTDGSYFCQWEEL